MSQLSQPPILSAEGLHWQVPGRTILNDVSFAVQPGQIVGLLGRNGSGKSSVLRSLLGLTPAAARQHHVASQPCALGSRALRQMVGAVFQAPSLDGKLTVGENLALSVRLQGLRGQRLQQAVARALAASGLTDRAHERAEVLSGGLRRRLELARAQQHQPPLLMLDEPTQGLDAASRHQFWADIDAARAERNLAVLVATHDPDEAARCDLLYILFEGAVVHCDTPQALLQRVQRDVVMLECDDAAQVAPLVASTFSLPARADGHTVVVPCERGHELVPKVVELVGAQRLRAVHLRRASLADAFVVLTGESLAHAGEALRAA